MSEKYFGLSAGYARLTAGQDYYTPYIPGLDDWTMGMTDGSNSMIAGWVSYTVKFSASLPPGGMTLRRIEAA